MVGKNVNHSNILRSLDGYNPTPTYTRRKGWNMDFQSYNKPLAYRVLEQDKNGGAGVIMIVALILGLIIAGCLGTL